MARADRPSIFPVLSSLFCKGVSSVSLFEISLAIFPTSVFFPVSTTTAVPFPLVIYADAKTMFLLSAVCAFSGRRSTVSFSTGTDSPVNADSSALRLAELISLASAATLSPASSTSKSPGTTSSESISFICPFLKTLACGTDSLFNSSMAFSALFSCITPRTALRMTIIIINNESAKSFSPLINETTKDAAADARRIIIITSLSCSKNLLKILFLFTSVSIIFFPHSALIISAFSSVSPFLRSVLSTTDISSVVLLCQFI